MKINILHFSDLHFKSNDTKIINLRDKIIDSMKDTEEVDLIIFSGDLLDKPSSAEFTNSYQDFIKPILEHLNVSIDNCFFTIGNHDVDLTKRNKLIFSGLKIEKHDKNIINDIVSGETPLNEFEDYINFVNSLKQNTLIENNNIYSICKTKVNNISIGNVSINTSLFMEGSSIDFGKLWIIPDLLIEVSKKMDDCDIKILNLHHPLEWLENKKEIEKIILDKFNLVFYGHEHNHDGRYITDLYNRDILSLYATSLYHPKNERNGFCLYTYYIDSNELDFVKKEHNKQQNVFETITNQKIENINLMKKASKAIRNQHICSEIYPNLKAYINKYLAINLTSEKTNKDIEEIYTHPKITEEKIIEDKVQKNEKQKYEKPKDDKSFSLDEIIKLNTNLILQGKQESGKTTILNMINVTYLKNYNDLIPIYISGNELHNEESCEVFIAKIHDYLSKFYNNSKLNIKSMVQDKRFIFLIDNIHNLTAELVKEIIDLDNIIIATFVVKEYEITEDKLLYFNKESEIYSNFMKFDIKPLRKKDNKLLTKNIVPSDVYQKISNKVVKAINNLRLPSNPFITTLLAWMYVEKIDIRENEPQIIDVFLDYLLEKAELSRSFDGKFDFSDKKDLLAAIANKFFLEQSLAIKEDKILAVIIDYSDKYYAFEINSQDILKYFYKRRILIRNNNLVQFSYRVFYYYFISLYMINNKDFYNSILENKTYIVNMIDELKYYAALKRDDINIINKIESYIFMNKLNTTFQKLPIVKNIERDKSEELIIEETIETNEDNLPISAKEKKLKDKIDDIETDRREKNVETFNHDTEMIIQDKKLHKEEFFVLNMIYAEFIKNLAGIDKNYKETYFIKAIDNYINIFRYWEEVFKKEKLLIKFFKSKFPNETDISKEELIAFNNSIKDDVLGMIAQVVDITLSTPKMTEFYSKLFENDKNPYSIFFALILETETEEDEINLINYIKEFVSKNTNVNLSTILRTKLLYDLAHKSLKLETQKSIKLILVDLEFKLNSIFLKKHNISKRQVVNAIEEQIKFAKLLA